METVIAFGLFLKQSNHLALEVLENVLFLNKLWQWICLLYPVFFIVLYWQMVRVFDTLEERTENSIMGNVYEFLLLYGIYFSCPM